MPKQLTHLKEMTGLTEAAGPGFFSEAKQYSDSGEFSDEFYDIFAQVNKMKKVMKNPKWMEYMKATDRNHSLSVTNAARDALKAVTDLENALIDIDRDFDRINDDSDSDAPPMDDDDSETK
jgi:hypothetical protein